MMRQTTPRDGERGTMLLIVVFIAAAIAGLAALSAGRVVAEARHQSVMENESRALTQAYGRIHLAMNVVNNSAYDAENHNLEIRGALAAPVEDPAGTPSWLQDPTEIDHGLIRSTQVRVYRARDYIQRLQKLKGESLDEVDPVGASDNYFVLEAMGRAGETVRLVSALVRENEPFSSFVFFQNRHPLGVSGSPRGLIHANESLEFYFPNGNYVDSVSAVDGFAYQAGATPDNTNLSDANPEAKAISLEEVDFADLKIKADLFAGQDGLDAEIKMYADGRVRIREYTPPRWDQVEREFSEDRLVGWTEETYMDWERVQIGTQTEERQRQIVVGYETETYTVEIPIYEWQEVERTRNVPVYERQTVTRTRWVQVFVPYETDAGGGTAVGGGGGVPGEYVWVEEEYQTEEDVLVGWEEETYMETVRVQVGTETEVRERQVPIYETETYTVEVPVYEWQEVEKTRDVPVMETFTWTEMVWEFFPPERINEEYVSIGDAGGTIYIDGRVTRLYGDLNGRLTIVGNEKVRVTGNLRYVDDEGDTAMINGNSYTEPYERNPDYAGDSTLGVIARDDVLFTDDMPDESEINATLMSVNGRVGIDGFAITELGEPTKDYLYGMTEEEREKEYAYNYTSYETERFRKDSVRRIGGLISNDRILETYIRARSDGTAYVDSGFKRGNMKFDINLLFNPPPNFVEVPRPVLSYFAPVFFVRNNDA